MVQRFSRKSTDGAGGSADSGLAAFGEFVRLGQGASGTVYRARELRSDRQVAIKQLRRRDDGASSGRFRREGRILTRLDHPNIVRVYDAFDERDELFLVLEYVAGPNLNRVLGSRQLKSSDALNVISQLSAALTYIHAHGVVHRDLSPANVLLTLDGCCKLSDFGMASLIDGHGSSILSFRTRTGAVLGTPTYMSPEAASGSAQLDDRADLYSLGVLTYEMLVGRPPFSEGDQLAVLEAHISQPVPAPTSLVQGFPKGVEEVLLQALSKRPRDRQRGVNVFWEQLDLAAGESWPEWRSLTKLSAVVSEIPIASIGGPRSPDRATVTLSTIETEPLIDPPVYRPKKRMRWWMLVALALLGGLLASGLILAFTHL